MKWHLIKLKKPEKNVNVLLYYPGGGMDDCDIITTGAYWGNGQWGADNPGFDPDVDVPLCWAKIEKPVFD